MITIKTNSFANIQEGRPANREPGLQASLNLPYLHFNNGQITCQYCVFHRRSSFS